MLSGCFLVVCVIEARCTVCYPFVVWVILDSFVGLFWSLVVIYCVTFLMFR